MHNSIKLKRLTICIGNLGEGGAQRAMIQLANKLKDFGWNIDILTFNAEGAYKPTLRDDIEIYETGKSIPGFLRKIRNHSLKNPDTIYLITQSNVVKPYCLAKRLGFIYGHVIIREANWIRNGQGPISDRVWSFFLPWLYRSADAWIALTQASAEQLRNLFKISSSRISVVPNAVDTSSVVAKGLESPGHPWLSGERDYSVVIGVGRLTVQKGFDSLIDAVALVNRCRPTKLIIIGTGALEHTLRKQAALHAPELDVDFTGFVTNPYAYVARGDVFVLSSRWEGSPNALIEALAIGIPCVACDCPSGPREILTSPELGILCPIDDLEAMAEAIVASLDKPGERHIRQEHMRRNHGVEKWARAYERIVLGVSQK
jgi:glycosyltransferase involved in cell wall biosynthesis